MPRLYIELKTLAYIEYIVRSVFPTATILAKARQHSCASPRAPVYTVYYTYEYMYIAVPSIHARAGKPKTS